MRGLDETGPSGISSSGSLSVKREAIEDLEDSDTGDCLVIDVLKSKKERTPELINISSGSESETNSQTHWKKKMSKQLEDKTSKGSKKPRLDRNSFSLHFSGTLNCQRGEHNYCTESAPPLNPGSNKTESDDDSFKISRNLYNPRKRWDLLSSSSDLDSEMHTDSNEEYIQGKRKHKTYKTRAERVSNSHSNSAHRLEKKDHKSKIKSSSRLKSKPSASVENPPTSISLRKRNLSNASCNNANVYSKRLRRHRSRSSSTSSSDSSVSSISSLSSVSSSSTSSHRSKSSSTSSSDSSVSSISSLSSVSSSSTSSHRSRSSSTSSSDSSVSSISSLSSVSSSSTSSSRSSSSASANSLFTFLSSSESDEKYYRSSHRKRNGKRLSKGKESKKRRYSEEKNKESKSLKERGKGTSKNVSSKSKISKREKKSSKRSTKDAKKHRYK